MLRKASARHAAEALAVSLTLLAIVFIAQWRFGYEWGDEGLLWYLSQRIHFGEFPVRDFHGYDPGRYLWSAAWFEVLGSNGLFEQRLANACFGVIGLTAACWAMIAAGIRRPLRMATIAWLACACWFPREKIYEQSLSLIAVALVAYALFAPASVRRWLLLGFATGLALIFGRNIGFYFGVATALGLAVARCLQPRPVVVRGLASYAAGTVIAYSPMVLWFVFDPRFREAMIQSILFIPRWQTPLAIPFPWRVAQDLDSVWAVHATATSWLCLVVFVMYAVAAAEVVSILAKRRCADRPFLLEAACLCVGIPYLVQGFVRADFEHMAQSILPIFILAAARLCREDALLPRMAGAVIGCISLLAWIPVEPRVAARLAFHHDATSGVKFNIDGRDFILDRDQAKVLELARREFDRCDVGPGQMVVMPYYAGIFAYLHTRSPIWDLYFLYQRTPDFQLQEISRMEAYGTKLAIINRAVAVDGREDLKIEKTNPVLVRYIQDHFRRLPAQGGATADFEVYERNCTK